ncbi:leucine-rich repeat-containing protein 66 [Saccopteryx bilineata]|uniref:leucine-rich repeat-containing protein 66 n=1 Tax=Saccopteryx bilineata TaxID=59482 RepID=UPI00338F4E08
MKNLCFRVITMTISLYFTGTMTNPSRKSSLFFVSECQWDGSLLTNCSFTGKRVGPADTAQTAATVNASFSFFKVLLQSPTEKEERSIKHLDLSNNLLSKITLSPLARLHALEILNLSNNAIHSISLDLHNPKSSWAKHHRGSMGNGLPYLKLLILQRNKLSDIPKGLWKLKSLQSLDLSFNGISQIGVSDFHNCLRLENLYLRSNKIFRIHLEAFKGLNNLQVVDLSHNALSTVLPMMLIALELPQLEADLTGNQWQCDESLALFQNFISESWRRKWDVICNKSPGNEEARWRTPKSRIPRETQVPHTNLNHRGSLVRSNAGQVQEGMSLSFPSLGKKDQAGSDPLEPRLPPRGGRSARDLLTAVRREAAPWDLARDLHTAVRREAAPQDLHTAVRREAAPQDLHTAFRREAAPQDPHTAVRREAAPRDPHTAVRREAAPQDLALAVCLAVFITFFVAFCLGALARPYVDRLWQQRCRKRRPGSDHVYPNEGFYDDVEASGSIPHPAVGLHQPCRGPNLYENLGSYLGTEANPQPAGIADRTLGRSRREPGSGQSREQHGNSTNASRKDSVLPNGSAAYSIVYEQPDAVNNALTSAEQDPVRRNDVLGEIHYETEAQEDSLRAWSVGIPAGAGRLRSGSGIVHKGSRALDPPLPRETTAALSDMHTYTNVQGLAENEESEGTEQSPVEFSEERQVSTSIRLLNAQEQRLEGAGAEEERSTCYSPAPPSDLREVGTSPPVLLPGWGHARHVTSANEDPVQKCAPDTQYELDVNYDSDEEGSLFTLSSESSEDARDVIQEEADGKESCRTSEPPEDKDSGVRKDNVTSFKGLEDSITFQEIQRKCENREDHFEKPLISGSDSGLYENHLQSAFNTNKFENPVTLPRSLGNSPSREGILGTPIDDGVTAPQSEVAEWHRSLRDLEFFNVDNLPQTPPHSAEVPLDPDKTVYREREPDIYKHEPFVQGRDMDQNSVPLQITSEENLRLPQQDSEGGSMHSNLVDTDANEGFVCLPEDCDSRQLTGQTHFLQFYGGEPSLV